MAETRRCPQCAETIQALAARCRFCGHDLSPFNPWINGARNLALVGFTIVAIGWIAGAVRGDLTPDAVGVAAAPLLDSARVAECEAMIRRVQQQGVIVKASPSGVAVNLRRWDGLSRSSQEGLVDALACAFYGRTAATLADYQYVSVTDARDGATIVYATRGSIDWR